MPRTRRFRSLSPWLWLHLLFLLLAFGAQFLPLTRELHYELSALAALWTSIGVGLASLVAWWRTAPKQGPVQPTIRAVGAAVATGAGPLLVSLLFNVVNGSCGFGDGLLWYVVLVPPSAVIAVAIARLAHELTRRRWMQVILFMGLWGASMARGAFEALDGPHIYLYAWQVGFFPGGSWDPELPITPLLLLYRASQLLIASLLLLVIFEINALRNRGARRGAGLMLPAALVGAIIVALLPLRSDIGLTRTDRWLRAELGDSVRTRFATIYYDATTTDSLDIWRAANYTDYYLWRQAGALGMAPGSIAPVTFYAFASGAEQKRLVGTSSASFTKPWRRTLNLAFDRVEATLEHELAHILLEPYGNILGVSWSSGLLEGSAVALEHADERQLLHRHARAVRDMGMSPPALRVMSTTGFASQRASLSYMLAGSFCRWLIDTHGAQRFLDAYASGSLEDSYGNVDTLAAEYDRFVASLPPTDSTVAPTVRYLYGGGSFFLQRCLRRIATLTGEGYRALGQERYDEALGRFQESLENGITAGARAGVIRTLHAAERFDALIDSMAVYLHRDSLGPQLLAYRIELADAFGRVGRDDDRERELQTVLQTGGEEWTRLRAAQRLFLGVSRAEAPSDTTSRAVNRLDPTMLDYFTKPMSLASRLWALGHAIDRTGGSAGGSARRTILRLMRSNLLARSAPMSAVSELADAARESAELNTVGRDPAMRDPAMRDPAMRDPAMRDPATYNSAQRGLLSLVYQARDASDTSLPSRIFGFAASALVRTLLDAHSMSIWRDGVTTPEERRAHVRLLDAAYAFESPMPRTTSGRELVLAERPRATMMGFSLYLERFGVVRTPRARR